jgi:hypothetical protein
VPFWQVSVCVHMLLSLQAVPFATFAGVEQVPLEGLQVLAILQAVAAGQVTGLLPVHVPLWQVSVCVHALPSLHVVPFATFAGVEQVPLEGLQVLAILQVVAAGQVTGLPPVHAPLWQVSVCVHALPSLHAVPLGAFVGAEQAPVPGLHVPATWHAGAVHVIAGPGTQAPLWQVSPAVQALLSVQVVPFVTGVHRPVAVAHI